MSGHLQFIGRKAEGMRFAAPALHAVSRRPASAVARPQTGSLRRLLALRGLPADILLIVAYIALSRAFIGDEARLGIKIGPLPLFVTDAILLVLIVMNLHKRGGRLLQWSFGGGGAGQIGRAVWLLFLITVVYFALAFPQYRLLAMRDLAIFGYSIFFPLTYFALTQRVQAAKLVRYFIYATCLGAALFEFQTLSGVKLFNVGEIDLGLAGHGAISRVSAGNLGADLGPALAGLFVYLVADREHRLLHAGAMLLCLTALVQILDRTALLGFAAAGFHSVGAVEIDPLAVRSYALNLRAGTEARDITLEAPVPDADVILGGPPCQAFARVGRAKLREIADHARAGFPQRRP